MSGDKFEKLLLDVGKTLAERQSRHGNFVEQANVSQLLLDVMRGSSNYAYLTAHQRESLAMIQIKIARILEGDRNYTDHWHDIAGYATLVERALRQDQERFEAKASEHPIRAHFRELMEDVTEAAIERRCIKGETAKWDGLVEHVISTKTNPPRT